MKSTAVKLIVGDCREVVPLQKKPFDLIFADPPFNLGVEYDGYDDSRTDFEQFTEEWVSACWNQCSGVMALHGPDALADEYLHLARKLKMHRIGWVNWHYNFGQCRRSNWIDSRCHCLIFAKDPKHYTWNPDDVLVPSARRSKYNDKRIEDTERGGNRLPGQIWGLEVDGKFWGRVPGNSKERRKKHPNQLPEVYLQRLIKAYSNPGDRILDPFAGSGTTAVVAKALNRHVTTIDLTKGGIASVRDRIKSGAVRIS